jgi:NTE family protein
VGDEHQPGPVRARIGCWALAARTMPEADRRKVFQARLPASDWPARMLKVTAVDARTGHFVVFDSAGEIGLVDAVAASCAVPGVWPPVTIGDRRFMDRSVRSVVNADLGGRIPAGGDSRAGGPGHRPDGQPAPAGCRAGRGWSLGSARAGGPRNVLDLLRRATAARAGRAQAAAEAAAVREVWRADGGPVGS